MEKLEIESDKQEEKPQFVSFNLTIKEQSEVSHSEMEIEEQRPNEDPEPVEEEETPQLHPDDWRPQLDSGLSRQPLFTAQEEKKEIEFHPYSRRSSDKNESQKEIS